MDIIIPETISAILKKDEKIDEKKDEDDEKVDDFNEGLKI
jgi:hypothetical protein